MNRFLISGLLVAGLLAAPIVSAKSVSFEVANNTGAPMTAIYTGPTGVEEWGDNILEGGIASGETVSITLSDLQGCKYDFRYEFKGKEAFEEFAIDVCVIDGDEYVIK